MASQELNESGCNVGGFIMIAIVVAAYFVGTTMPKTEGRAVKLPLKKRALLALSILKG